jgi:hypothetical protein
MNRYHQHSKRPGKTQAKKCNLYSRSCCPHHFVPHLHLPQPLIATSREGRTRRHTQGTTALLSRRILAEPWRIDNACSMLRTKPARSCFKHATQKLVKGVSQGDTGGELCLAPAIKKPRPPNDANRRKQISCSLHVLQLIARLHVDSKDFLVPYKSILRPVAGPYLVGSMSPNQVLYAQCRLWAVRYLCAEKCPKQILTCCSV